MTDNVSKFPTRDLIAEMTGPALTGHSVIISGRLVPKLALRENGDEIEFILDGHFAYSFPKEIAWLAAAFAADAMAVGAGFASLAGKHNTQREFGTRVMNLADAGPTLLE